MLASGRRAQDAPNPHKLLGAGAFSRLLPVDPEALPILGS